MSERELKLIYEAICDVISAVDFVMDGPAGHENANANLSTALEALRELSDLINAQQATPAVGSGGEE